MKVIFVFVSRICIEFHQEFFFRESEKRRNLEQQNWQSKISSMKEGIFSRLGYGNRAPCSLNALSLKRYHLDLTKREFRDGIALRFRCNPVKLPLTSTCGEKFDLAHAFHCPKGGYTNISDDRDFLADLQ